MNGSRREYEWTKNKEEGRFVCIQDRNRKGRNKETRRGRKKWHDVKSAVNWKEKEGIYVYASGGK